MHSMKGDNINSLFSEVLSWSVDDILKQKQHPFKVETIPDEFKNCVDYRAAFHNPTLEEVRYQMDCGIDTSSIGLYVRCYKKIASSPNEYTLTLNGGNAIPSRGDLMLLSKCGLQSRDQIINDGSFCTILVVMSTTKKNDTILAYVRLSHLPYGGNLNEQNSYQVLHLANLTTFYYSWEAMTRVRNKSPEIFNLILTKDNDCADGEQFADKGNSLEGAYGGFELNDSQIDAVASCISASKCSKKSSVRLIWGPPGTGKTKTVSVVLLMLLKFPGKHRTLVCAPTNTALVQLASRLVSLVKESNGTSLLQHIIMFGSEKLKKIGSGLSEIFLDNRVEERKQREERLRNAKLDCAGERKLRDECLRDAKLVICTPFSSSRLENQRCDTLVIDEAAYLKEFESVIPLAVEGIKHVVLIGDDKQLESLVMSPIAKEAKYGRSLFERLCKIGYHKKLLDKQYRMHPSISKFPNENFYDGKIEDATEGMGLKLHTSGIFLGHIFGHFSFIHVEDGIEEPVCQSLVNMVEVEVATNIVQRLSAACTKMEEKTRVGVISQYSAQVTALQKSTEDFHNHEFLSVEVQTVDSCQGDEKDIIIFSTVRCNDDGNIGFLDSDRRANVALTRARNWLWILGHGPTLTKSKSIWSKLVKDAQKRNCFFSACQDLCLADAIDDFKDRHMKKKSDMDQCQLSSLSPCSQIDINAQLTGDSPVEAAIEEVNVDFSPSHTPSRKRPRSLHKDQLARPEVTKVGEPAPTRVVEAAVEEEAAAEEEDVKILILEESTQLREVHAMNRWKSMTKRAKRANFYEKDRSATDTRFWSMEQQDMYNCVYKTKEFADNKWINWEEINDSEEIKSVEEKFNRIGLHKLMGTRKDWDKETVRQFFSTVYINPERTFLTWMSGINMKVTVTKRFFEKVILDQEVHNCKIEDKLTDAQQNELKEYIKDNGHYLNAANRLVRKTIYPRAGDSGKLHNDNRVLLYHILFEKPFDVVDMMLREIEKTRTDNRLLIPYAPYIMLLINSATKGKFVPQDKDKGCVRHLEYKIVQMENKRPQSKRASKSKNLLHVPPLVNQRQKHHLSLISGKTSSSRT